MKESRPIPVRFPVNDEKDVRIFAIETDRGLSEAIRFLVKRGLEAVRADATTSHKSPPSPGRRVLSRGVTP